MAAWYQRGSENFNIEYTMKGCRLESVYSCKDLGVTFDSCLIFHKHISDKINKACSMLGLSREILRMFPWSVF